MDKDAVQFWSNRKAPPSFQKYLKMQADGKPEDIIAKEMHKDNIPHYWINKFFTNKESILYLT